MNASQPHTPTHDPREVRRNFGLLSTDSILYYTGLGFLDQYTILPAFLATLTDSPIAIGAIIAIRPAGMLIPQLWTAHYLRGRIYHKSFLLKVAAVARIAIAIFAVIMFMAGPEDRALMLWSFVGMYTLLWLTEGGAGVSWMDLTAKAIPQRLRGRLFGFIQAVGGVLVVGVGFLATRMLSPEGPEYPRNYAVLCGLSAVLLALSMVALAMVREPEGAAEDHDGDFLDYARRIGRMVAGHGQMKRLLAVQMLMGFLGMSLPFYILYAEQAAGIRGGAVGMLLSVHVAGSVVSSMIGGYLCDHHSPRLVIIMTMTVGVFVGALSLLIGDASVWAYGLLFFAIGWVVGSGWIGLTNFVLELAEPHERRSYTGVMNTANAPTLIFPVLGGVIVQMFSHTAVFSITAAAFLAALVLSIGLRPRLSES